jgi:hypothetical protein
MDGLWEVSAADSGLPLESFGQQTVTVRRGAVVLRACVAERVVHALTLVAPVVLLNQLAPYAMLSCISYGVRPFNSMWWRSP